MTNPTFSPPLAPSIESGRSMKPRLLTASFGDGYNQRAPDGLNHMLETMTVAWSRLQPADAQTISAFFEARGGVEAFYWIAPRDAAPKLWLCESWDTGYPTQTHESIRASFRQVPR